MVMHLLNKEKISMRTTDSELSAGAPRYLME
jgi:hypothetical protein